MRKHASEESTIHILICIAIIAITIILALSGCSQAVKGSAIIAKTPLLAIGYVLNNVKNFADARDEGGNLVHLDEGLKEAFNYFANGGRIDAIGMGKRCFGCHPRKI